MQAASIAPGPGAYAIPSTFSSSKKAAAQRAAAAAPAAVSWERKGNPPSIPSRFQSFGYEQGEAGDLIPQAAPESGHTGKGHGTHCLREQCRSIES